MMAIISQAARVIERCRALDQGSARRVGSGVGRRRRASSARISSWIRSTSAGAARARASRCP